MTINLTKTKIMVKSHDVISQKTESPMTIDDGCLCKTALAVDNGAGPTTTKRINLARQNPRRAILLCILSLGRTIDPERGDSFCWSFDKKEGFNALFLVCFLQHIRQNCKVHQKTWEMLKKSLTTPILVFLVFLFRTRAVQIMEVQVPSTVEVITPLFLTNTVHKDKDKALSLSLRLYNLSLSLRTKTNYEGANFISCLVEWYSLLLPLTLIRSPLWNYHLTTVELIDSQCEITTPHIVLRKHF